MAEAWGSVRGWSEWRAEREASLQDPLGWLALVELVWLDESPRLLTNFPGKWSAEDPELLKVDFPTGPLPEREGAPIENPLAVELRPGDCHRLLTDKKGREVEVFNRFGRIGVRVRDPKKARSLAQKVTIDTYEYDPKWVVRGRLLPFQEPQTITVGAAVPWGSHEVKTWAKAQVVLPGEQVVDLAVLGEDAQSSSVWFHDATNGDTTSQWRAAPVMIDGETVVIDFNRAQIFPAHMSDFGTCPRPPEGNRLDVRVKAGEKKVSERDVSRDDGLHR